MNVARRMGIALARPIRRWRIRKRQRSVADFRAMFPDFHRIFGDEGVEKFIFGNVLEEL